MKFNELYHELRKKLQFDKEKVNIENIPDDEKKMLVQLCDYNKKVSIYRLNEEGNVLEISIWPKEEFKLNVSFPCLEDLSVYYATTVDTSFLSEYNTLKTLGLSYCHLKWIPDLSNQPYLEDIHLYSNDIKKIEGLGHLSKLTRLGLEYNQLSKIENLEKLTNLKSLALMNNQFTNIEGLENLTNLENFGISENRKLTSFEGLKGLTKIKQIGLSQCAIQSVDGFREFEGYNKLEFLNLRMNRITEIDVKVMLPALEKLLLSENRISKVHINGNFPSLTELELQENEITKIQNISNLPKLKYLTLGENKFETLENISNLPSLNNVSIHHTPVKHIKNLDLPESCMISAFLEERFSDQERAEMEQQIKSLGLRDYWVNERYYWD